MKHLSNRFRTIRFQNSKIFMHIWIATYFQSDSIKSGQKSKRA